MTDSSEASRKGYSWSVVKPGLARDLYTVMKSRSQHRGEALSTYVNVIAELVEKSSPDYSTPPVLDDAQVKIDKIIEVLGIGEMLADQDSLRVERDRLAESLGALKELLTGI